MATVSTVTRQIFVPNVNSNGAALDVAISQIIAAINAQTVTLGPFKEQTQDNTFSIITVSWPPASDTAFVSSGVMATVATSLGLATLYTHQVTSTSAY